MEINVAVRLTSPDGSLESAMDLVEQVKAYAVQKALCDKLNIEVSDVWSGGGMKNSVNICHNANNGLFFYNQREGDSLGN